MILRHRDRELLRFEWVEPQGVRVVSVNEAERRFLPLEMHGVANDETLADPRFADIFFFDAVIFNTDRHMGNFGYLVDNDTNGIAGAAPIFDNGYGLFSLALQIKSNLRADPFMTYVELAELLQVSESSIARKLKDLQASGEIRRIGADKNGHWEVVER